MDDKEDIVAPRKATLKILLASAGREGWVTARIPRKMRGKLYHPGQSARKLGGGGWGSGNLNSKEGAAP